MKMRMTMTMTMRMRLTMRMRIKMKILKKNNIVKDSNIQKLKEETKQIKVPNWLDKNKIKEILTIIDSNKFGHKNKIGEFKYIDIKDMFNNIKDNTISEIDAKKRLNALKIIKTPETKDKRLIAGQKELLNLFDLLDTILTDKTLISSKDEKEKLKEENENENENEETMSQSKIKELNDHLDEIIGKSKSFED